MFDAEKLFGKIVGEVLDAGGMKHGKKKKKSSMFGGLGSGSGLMTVVGLGVGAYEIWKQQSSQGATPHVSSPPPPPSGQSNGYGPSAGTCNPGATPPPPPPLSMQGTATPPNPSHPAPEERKASISAMTPPPPIENKIGGLESKELALRMIQVMVAAAHADGSMDAEEEKAVLDKLRGADLSQEEKMFLLNELHQPKSIETLTAGIDDLGVGRTMYMLAVASITIDTEAERRWLDALAAQLGLSPEMQSFLEEQ